ncbi:MAG: hypothetical protein OXR82_17535 [Gammaproteobacteria bacterium]|nr:hypothetical protein [Gammaproteobacteria bacterium]
MKTKERVATIPIAEVEAEIEQLVAKAATLREQLQATERTARERETLLRLIAERGWDSTVNDLKGVSSPVAIERALSDGSALTVLELLGRMERRGWTTKARDKGMCLRSLLQRAEELGIVRPAPSGPDGMRRWEAIPPTEKPAPTEADTGSQVTAVA